MSDNIKVVVKVRPLISREKEDKLALQWRVRNNTLHQLDNNGEESGVQYTFDKVYDEATKTEDVYNDIAKPIVEAAISGFNGTIFAYGQTSSGKTYTMSGTEDSLGIVQLAVINLFERIKCIPDRDFLVRVSYIEIYNETLKDLLNGENDKIKVRDTLQGVKVEATEKFTSSPEEVIEIMKEGEANRQIGATLMNEESSRSHSIFQITIESREHVEGEEGAGSANVSTLNLVDLAGSERSGQTGATGKRFKEGTHINKSLSTLALVIKQLSEEPPHKHINYRDSKLTRILQNALGGNAKTSIICAVTPAALEETISTLQFANRAKSIKNKPEVNAVATDKTKLQDLTKQLSKLQMELAGKKHIEEDNRNLMKRIAGLQKMILNGFGQQSVDLGGCRRKTWCAPRRQTISTLHSLDEDKETSILRFRTPNLKYNPMCLPNPKDFQPVQRPSQLAPVSEEAIMITPPKDKKDNTSDDLVIVSDSDDENTSNTSHCSPYHKCYTSSKTPPCVLRKNAKMAERNLKDIVELTKREKMYNPEVVEYMEKLEQSTNTIARLEDNLKELDARNIEKDSEMAQLKSKIVQTENEVKMFSSVKAELEVRCKEYNTKITDLEVSYETLKMKAKLREDELLSLLNEQTNNKKPKDHGKSLSRNFDKDFGNFMDLSKDISLVSDHDSSIETSNTGESTTQLQDLINDMNKQLTAKNETILNLERDLFEQKLQIETLENTCKDIQEQITESNSKLKYVNEENSFLKSSIETLNTTIKNQKENLEAANNDMKSYNSVIQELQTKLLEKNSNIDLNISDSLLETMVAHEETVIANNENLRNIIHSFKIALDTRTKEITSLKSALECKTSVNCDLTTEQLQAKEEQRCALVEEVQKIKYQLDENLILINKLTQDNEDLIKDRNNLSEKLLHAEKLNFEYEKHNHELQNQSAEYNNQLREFNANHDKLLQNLKEFKNNLSEHEKQKEELGRLIATLKEEILSKENVITSHVNERIELQKEVEVKDNLIAELESEIESKNGLITTLNNNHTELQNELAARDNRITDLESKITTKDELIASLHSEHANMQSDVLTKNCLITDLQNKLLTKDNLLTSLNNEHTESKDYLCKSKSIITKLQQLISVLTGDVCVESDLIDDSVAVFSTLFDRINVVEVTAKEVVSQKELAVVNNNKLEQEIDTLREQLEALIQEKVVIENDRDTINKDLNQLKIQLQELEANLQTVNDTNQKLSGDITAKENFILSLQNEHSNCGLKLDEALQQTLLSKKEIENLQALISANRATSEELLQRKNEEISKLQNDSYNRDKLLDENIIQIQKLSKTLEETVQNRDHLLENINKMATDFMNKLETQSDSYLFTDSNTNVYNNIIQILSKATNDITYLKDKTVFADVRNKELEETKKDLETLRKHHDLVVENLTQAENENKLLLTEIKEIKIINKRLSDDLSQSSEILRRLEVELKGKLDLIETLQSKIEEWKTNFASLEESMKHQILELQDSNFELQLRCSQRDTNETYSVDRVSSDVDSYQTHTIRKSLTNILVEPTNTSPQSLLTLCCNKIIDAIQPSETDLKSGISSSSSTNIKTESIGTQTHNCDCSRMLTEKEILFEENVELKSKVDFLQFVNLNLLKEQEDVRKELKLLVEPAYDLQRKISNHKTNLSTLTATTYAENKLLKSQVKVLQHHNNRFYNVCQRDLPAFKKSLQDLSMILKNTHLATRLESSIKRYSLPEVFTDKNSSTSNFRDESILDGDLLMLDTNVTLASVDNTMLTQDQSCLDGTQMYLDNEINADLIQEIDPNVLHTQLQMTSVENERLREKIESLKVENTQLQEKLEKYAENVKSSICIRDAQNSPIKLNNTVSEKPLLDTEYKACERCYKENKVSSYQQMVQKIQILTIELSEVRVQKEDLENKCANLNQDLLENDKLILKNSALEKENKMKLSEIDQLTRKLKNYHNLQEENDLLSTQVMESIDEADSLKKEVDALKDSNTALTAKCAELEEFIKSKNIQLSAVNACENCVKNVTHSPLNRSHSDSESTSCFNKLSTLQNELLAGREDCKTISDDVATIKNSLDRSNLSMSHNMDLDDSMGESNLFSFAKELNQNSPKTNKFDIAVVPEECPSDMYTIDKSDCFNYYIEKTGAENNLAQDTKIIDVMKMFYNNLIAKHSNEVQNLINNLKDFEESRNYLHDKINNINVEYEKIKEEIKNKDNSLNSIANVVSQIRHSIGILNEELSNCDVEKSMALVTMYKDNVLNILATEFHIPIVSTFESLMNKMRSKNENDLHEMISRCTSLQQTVEKLTSELNSVTENLSQIKCQLSEKEKEYELLNAQKEKVHEINKAVTLDMVKKEKELINIIDESCQTLVQYNSISPDEIDLSLPLPKTISYLLKKFIQRSKQSDLTSQEKHNLQLEVTKYKSLLEEKDLELDTLKSEVTKVLEMHKSANNELLIKNAELQSNKSLHEQLNKVYEKKVEENDANMKIIEKLTQEILICKESQKNTNEDNGDSEAKVKTEELVESINRLEHENKNLKSINEMIRNESEENALQLAKADETIKINKIEIDKMTAEILALNSSVKESLTAIDSLRLEAQSLLDQNVALKTQFEEANELCSRLKLNIKTHEKTAEMQCKIIRRLKQENEDNSKATGEKDKQLQEMTQTYTTLQKDYEKLTVDAHQCKLEVDDLKKAKELLEKRIFELEGQLESHKPRVSLGSGSDSSRRRRQGLLDSKRMFGEEKHDTDHKKIEAYFSPAAKPDEMFMDVDDNSNRSTPIRNRRSDSFHSRNEESDRDEGSRPGSALERRRRRQSIHDQHRITTQPLDHLNTLNEVNIGSNDDRSSEVSDLKERLQLCQQELEELRERYREVDEECEICAQYLRERDEQCVQLKNDNKTLQQQITELNEKMHNASVTKSQKNKCSRVDASVNTDEDWTNLHSLVVDRMSFDREVEKNKELKRTLDELRFKYNDLKTTLAKMQKNAERAAKNKANLQELEAVKLELKSCKRELEECKERCKELDEECDTCGEYLREKDDQICRLRESKDTLQAKLEQLLEKEVGAKAHSVRKKRQSMHDQNRNSTMEYADASTETSEDLLNNHVERDNTSMAQNNEIQQLKMAMEMLAHQKNALELQLRSVVAPQPLLPPVYVATGSAIVQNQHMTDIMKENQKLKKINAKLITICKKRGKPLGESNRENDDPADMG